MICVTATVHQLPTEGVDLVAIRAVMGHSTLATTGRYLQARTASGQATVFTRAAEPSLAGTGTATTTCALKIGLTRSQTVGGGSGGAGRGTRTRDIQLGRPIRLGTGGSKTTTVTVFWPEGHPAVSLDLTTWCAHGVSMADA